jgi:hypothetical protein
MFRVLTLEIPMRFVPGLFALSAVTAAFLVVGCTPVVSTGGEGEGEGEGESANACEVSGESVIKPADAPTRPATGAINLTCIGNPQHVGPSTNVTLEGCINVFGLGGAAKPGLHVSVFGADQDPSTETPAHGDIVIATKSQGGGLDCAGADSDAPACRAASCEKQGFYRVDSVPTNVPLLLKVYAVHDNTVIDTYIYDLFVRDTDVVAGRFNYEASLVYRSTYDSIPTIVGQIIEGGQTIGDGKGRGVIAGEVHDCDDKIIANAAMTSSQLDSKSKLAYFDGNTSNPNPDLRRKSTNTDGLYAIMNATTDPGKNVHTLAGGILDPTCTTAPDCQCVSLGSRTVRVFPDSVTIATLRGDVPTQN